MMLLVVLVSGITLALQVCIVYLALQVAQAMHFLMGKQDTQSFVQKANLGRKLKVDLLMTVVFVQLDTFAQSLHQHL